MTSRTAEGFNVRPVCVRCECDACRWLRRVLAFWNFLAGAGLLALLVDRLLR